jgi:hypothetical protein
MTAVARPTSSTRRCRRCRSPWTRTVGSGGPSSTAASMTSCASRRAPKSQLFQLGQSLARSRHSKGHVRPSDRVYRQIGAQPRLMERSQKAAEWAGQSNALPVVQRGFRDFTTWQERSAVERPTVLRGGLPDVCRPGNRERHELGEFWQMGGLVDQAADHHLATWESKDPFVVDEPHRRVPALPEQTQRAQLEVGKLRPNQPPRERLVNRDLGGPLAHAARLSAAPARGRVAGGSPAPTSGNVT